MPKSNKPPAIFHKTHTLHNSNGNCYEVMVDPNFINRRGHAMVICRCIFADGERVPFRGDRFIVCEISMPGLSLHQKTPQDRMGWYSGEYDMTLDQAITNRAKRFRG